MPSRAVVIAFVVLAFTICAVELLSPYTKVEESFNMQAMHDFLFTAETTAFDHHLFPGVVPRTFAGAWLVSLLTLTPFAFVVEPLVSAVTDTTQVQEAAGQSGTERWMRTHAKVVSHLCRGVLGALVLWSLWSVVKAIGHSVKSTNAGDEAHHTKKQSSHNNKSTNSKKKHSKRDSLPRGTSTAASHINLEKHRAMRAQVFFCLLCAGQFHLVFYATRALPNTFGLVFTTFALSRTLRGHYRAGIALLAMAATLFRCDVLALIAPYGLYVTCASAAAAGTESDHENSKSTQKQTQTVGSFLPRFFFWLFTGVVVGLVAVALSVSLTALGLDSFLWRRWLWPEGVVLLFNTVDNKASEWGVAPPHWYWTRALPRALLCAYPVVLWLAVVMVGDMARCVLKAITGQRKPRSAHTAHTLAKQTRSAGLDSFFCKTSCSVARRHRPVLLPALTFIALYSALPHKELRFILIVFPWLLVPVAVWLAEVWVGPHSNQWRVRLLRGLARVAVVGSFALLFVSCGASVLVSATNYPGGTALHRLEAVIASDVAAEAHLSSSSSSGVNSHRPVTVFVDAYAAMSGINRFQKTFFEGHAPLFPSSAPGTDTAVESVEQPQRHSLWSRWRALAVLPVETLVWRAQACLGPVQDAFRGAVDAVRTVVARRAAPSTSPATRPSTAAADGETCEYILSSFSSSSVSASSHDHAVTSSHYVRYVKDPSLFLTAEEVHAMEVAARTGRAGPKSGTQGEPATSSSSSSSLSAMAVYKSNGIDYALVRASQWTLHLVDHDVFELLFVQQDDSKQVLTEIKTALRTCLASRRPDVCAQAGLHVWRHIVQTLKTSLCNDKVTGRPERTAGLDVTDVSYKDVSTAYLLALRRRA